MNANLIHSERSKTQNETLKGSLVGVIGGLVGTIVMDLFGAGMFLAMGGPASLSFTIIGDAAAGFFSASGIEMAGGAPLGAVLHYLIGLVFGIIFVAIVSRIDMLNLNSLKKGVGLGIVFVEIMSQPMLIAAAIILKMTPAQTAQWFGMSFIMHLVYGGVLGLIASYGLNSAKRLR